MSGEISIQIMVKIMKNSYSSEWFRLTEEQQKIISRTQETLPVKVGAVAMELGLIVRSATLPVGISGEIRPDKDSRAGYKIRVNRHEAKTRQRFTLAHEISHYLLHKDQIGDGIEDSILYRSNLSDRREAEANRLAADILMPWHLVSMLLIELEELEDREKIDTIAHRLEVSRPAIEIRLGLLD